MTVRELAMLARIIIRDYPEYYPLFAQREFQYRHHKFFNRNPLLGVGDGRRRAQDRLHQGSRATASSPRPRWTTAA